MIATRVGGVDPSAFPDELFELYSIAAHDRGKPDFVKGKEIGSVKPIVEPNDVLISRIVPHIRRASIVGLNNGLRQIASSEWIVFRDSRIYPQFLRHFLVSNRFNSQFMSTVAGVGGSLLRARPVAVAKIKIPLPPLDEQKRIALVLDQADALREKRRLALQKLDSLTQSIFIEMFGDPVKNPKDWEIVLFDEVCKTRLGKMLDEKKRTGKDLRPYLRNANVQWNRFDLSSVFEMDFDERERSILRLEYGDLLICEGGEVGRCAIWRNELPECYYQKALHKGRPNLEKVSPEYLLYLLWFFSKNNGFKDYVTSVTIAHLTGEKLKSVKIPLPPLELQNKFSEIVKKIEAMKAEQQKSLEKLENLFQSLQQRAFKGELFETENAKWKTENEESQPNLF